MLALLAIGLRLAMPGLVKRYVNQTLQKLPGYGGSIGDVDIHLWRGAYTIHDVNVVKQTNSVPVPFLAAQQVDFSVQWKEIRNRALVGEVVVDRAQLNFAKGKSKNEDQTSIDKSWTEVVGDLFPFKINRFELRDSEVWFHDFGTKPKVELFVTNCHIVCSNITNSRNSTNELPTPFRLTGTVLGGGNVAVSGRLNPFSESPRFDVDAKLENTDLTALNDFFKAYANVDIERGTLQFYTEMAAANGRFKGYVKPLLQDLDIVDLKDARNPLKLFWESFVAGVVKVFKNQNKDQFGTKVPLEGAIENPNADILSAIGNVLRNAFVKALSPRVEGEVGINSVKPSSDRPPVERDTRKDEK
ncbi:MAG TPA: DUF748 domain-containing protein [Candidatus Acidoferrum sp.]|nr:DUF748 domain-containing protein [Candidatus Acidoferrum sp.]